MWCIYIFLILLTFTPSYERIPDNRLPKTIAKIEDVPPSPSEVALMARYIIHESDWVSFATVSTLKTIKNYPFVTLKSMSDGPVEKGSGVPYLYMTNMDLSGQDILKNNKCTIMASLAESDYCKQQNFDPQDPRCAKVMLTGKLIKMNNATSEYAFAQNALYLRHPEMKGWPTDHDFYIAKVNIQLILVLDFFGGVKSVTVEDYFNANSNTSSIPNIIFDDVMVIEVRV